MSTKQQRAELFEAVQEKTGLSDARFARLLAVTPRSLRRYRAGNQPKTGERLLVVLDELADRGHLDLIARVSERHDDDIEDDTTPWEEANDLRGFLESIERRLIVVGAKVECRELAEARRHAETARLYVQEAMRKLKG